MPIDLQKIEDSSHLRNILLQMEDILDSLDLYVFKNWILGEVVEGPVIERHWASFTLLYSEDRKPDEKAKDRLAKQGILVKFDKVKRQADDIVELGKEKPKQTSYWMVKITFPKRLLDQMEQADIDAYADEMDTDDVVDAQDAGLNDQSAFTSPSGNDMSDPQMSPDMGGDDELPPQ